MELGTFKLGDSSVKAIGQFVVYSKHQLDTVMLADKLRDKLHNWYGDSVQVHKEEHPVAVCAYRATFPMSVKPLPNDLSISTIMGCLNEIELSVEKALKIREFMEMVE